MLPGDLDELGERVRVVDRDLGQRLAVEDHLGVDQPGDELAVAHPPSPAGRVDADDPQAAELALAYPPVAEGVLPPADQCHDRLPVQVVPAESESLGQLPGAVALPEDRLAATGSHGSVSSGGVEARVYRPPMAVMYLSAVGPVLMSGLRACRLLLDVRPASRCRRLP